MKKTDVRITETSKDREYWASRDHLSANLRSSLQHATIIILPDEGFRDHVGPVFPVGTEELLRFIEKAVPAEFPVEIAVDDDKYVELVLHSELILLGTFLITSIAAPILVNVLSDYIKRRVGSAKKNAEVRVEIKVETGVRTTSCSYEGPAEQFAAVMSDAVQRLTPATQVKSPTVLLDTEDDGDKN